MQSLLWTFLSMLAMAAAMPTMYTQTTTLRIQIFEFANHTRLIIKTLTVTIIAHCGGSGNGYAPLPASAPHAQGSTNGTASVQSAIHHTAAPHALSMASFSRTELVVGVFLLSSFCLLVLSMLSYLGFIIYHSIGETIAYTSIKQQEVDEETKVEAVEEDGEAAPAYCDA
ncbi:protein of unknown function [Taphrina deformans PYCC 5710]|uniref:Uncharacterized protein n=1 Tax=Taphrina deformans (strain PYCC 5710 / ATCC 11124 / CBS 356.35 / IMI 108563 / JCM 9778 / NBRC 8474) TaxID=1097556 RepID=R4X976_TAPDE|nr:protein of unknown function [Taphrina deformans PYCC 5710]|eukprot:CCG80727.1 protein of unknown function [Taphrina deformans PYCC 5710]